MTVIPVFGREVIRISLLLASVTVCGACSRGEASDSDTATREELLPGGDAPQGPILHASGFEPGWTLDIFSDHMVYVGRYGEERVVTPAPELISDEDTEAEPRERRYVAHTDTYDFQVRVVEETCQGPSGRGGFPVTVFLTVDGQEYRGCGRRN